VTSPIAGVPPQLLVQLLEELARQQQGGGQQGPTRRAGRFRNPNVPAGLDPDIDPGFGVEIGPELPIDPGFGAEPESELPIIPFPQRQRGMRLDEIGDANVVGRRKRTFKDDLADVFQNIGESGIFDPFSEEEGVEGFLDAALGSAFGTFAGVRRGRANRESDEQLAIENAEVRERGLRSDAARGARDEEEFEATMDLLRAQTGAAQAQAAERSSNAFENLQGETLPEVESLAQRFEDRGDPQMAQFIRENPALVAKTPSSFLRRGSVEETEEDESDEEAAERADRADAFGAREIAARERSAVGSGIPARPGVLNRVFPPEERESELGRLRRLQDPTFVADSTIRARIRGGGSDSTIEPQAQRSDELDDRVRRFQNSANPGSTALTRGRGRTPARATSAAGSTRASRIDPQDRRRIEAGLAGARSGQGQDRFDPELQRIADGLDPGRMPLVVAVRALSDASVQPPLTLVEREQILLRAGYKSDDVRETLRGER